MDRKTLDNFIPINRRLFDHALWKEPRPYSKFEAWLDLLQQARFENTEAKKLIGNKVVKWNRGQLIGSLRFLAERWAWSTKKVTHFFETLQKEGMATRKTDKETGQSIVTICNYETYNSLSDERKQEGNTRETGGKQEGNETNKENIENTDIILPPLPPQFPPGSPENIFKSVDVLADEAMKDELLIMAAMSQANVKPEQLAAAKAKFPDLMNDFVIHLKSEEKTMQSVAGFRNHFKNWFAKRLHAKAAGPPGQAQTLSAAELLAQRQKAAHVPPKH